MGFNSGFKGLSWRRTEGVREQGAEGDIWIKERGRNKTTGKLLE